MDEYEEDMDVVEDANDAAALVVDAVEDPNMVISSVKMKLASFVSHAGLRALIDASAIKASHVVAEANAFANFHITRLLTEGRAVPLLDRTLYYACLSTVSIMKTRATTIKEDMKVSALQFNQLRVGQEKVDARDLMDLMPDLSITMATAAVNHMWTNLSKRIKTYLKWTCPELATYHDTIALFVAEFPTMPITDINQLKHVDKGGVALPAGTVVKRQAAA
jgi:hypothetical protein